MELLNENCALIRTLVEEWRAARAGGESAENESESNAVDIYDISVYNRTINQTFTYRREQKTETNKQTKRKLNGCQLAARWQTNCTTGSTPPLHHHCTTVAA